MLMANKLFKPDARAEDTRALAATNEEKEVCGERAHLESRFQQFMLLSLVLQIQLYPSRPPKRKDIESHHGGPSHDRALVNGFMVGEDILIDVAVAIQGVPAGIKAILMARR
ncbi:hypothetical protein HHK36_032125 [Tetracentron sinense]|uniref:Uncharacterized protein n=1 Tax=Tetracentron sinense TaxID=13715 RepID=A0A835CXF9_TETSI|nr:hypothetical protein HHK36_032125 [Tetracentron sinense]